MAYFVSLKNQNQAMIYLFRKIRHQLIANNRFKKYVLYALGEIFLVMIGILLALQFNTWNQEKENNIKEEWYLINIVEDIEYQKKVLKEMKIFSLESIEIGKSILKQYNTNKSFIDVDSLDKKLNVLMESFIYPNTNNTYTELVSSGQFDLIKDKDLNLNIISYFSTIEENHINAETNIMNIFYPEIYPIYNKFSQAELYEENINEDESYLLDKDEAITKYINELLEKPDSKLLLTNAIRTQISILSDDIVIIDDTLEFSIEVIQLIDDYLGLTSEDVNHYD